MVRSVVIRRDFSRSFTMPMTRREQGPQVAEMRDGDHSRGTFEISNDVNYVQTSTEPPAIAITNAALSHFTFRMVWNAGELVIPKNKAKQDRTAHSPSGSYFGSNVDIRSETSH